MTLETVMTTTGLQVQTPAELNTDLIDAVKLLSPGYTANLPGSLIDDISSTDVGALIMADQARVDLINSVTPYGANEFLLNQLGQIYGPIKNSASNTSVYVTFTGIPGYVIPQGFIVSDGTYQYIVQSGVIIPSGGTTGTVYCLASDSGSWAVPVGTVTTIITSVPASVSLSVTNLTAGTPGGDAETWEAYRARVLQSGLATSSGTGNMLKTLLSNVSGVQARLISYQQSGTKWKVLCGGGDPYDVAYAIWQALFDTSNLVGSTLSVLGLTAANPGVITTDLNHGFSTGQVIQITGMIGPTALNGVSLTVTVLTEKTFSIGVNTTSLPAWTSGGMITPNLRNESISINSFPDTYVVPFIVPPQQTVGITVTWNTQSNNYVSEAAIAQLANPAIVDYINGIYAGQPINLLELQSLFQTTVANVIATNLITSLSFVVTIDGVITEPESGTQLINGDAESYFYTDTASITINQG
ncbi:baseplate J/gp47 family protein [Martelella alba]|uniref:Baseplate J-like family protein n=1 Tax=Martelella alba TaxID=2590451 RepID=A0ABY2SRG7_9HYPH|nr:baseplate J/gp47 family protein [Martelella alba]TKI08336.1 baseplate J-like family protein [Martelella alba]